VAKYELRPVIVPGKALVAAERLRDLARELLAKPDGAPPALPGERELAGQLGLSRRTLQNALGILAACGVVRREHGRGNFAEPESRWQPLPAPGLELLVVAPWGEGRPEGYMFAEMLGGMETAAGAIGARLTGLDAAAWTARASERGFAARFRGAVLIDPPGARWAASLLDAADWHVVAVEHNIRDLPLTSVIDGSYLGNFEATQALLELGHRRIAFLDRADWQSANPHKSEGWLAALEEAGGSSGRELFRTVPTEAPREAVVAAMEEFWALSEKPSAVLCFSDAAALGVLEWMAGRGLTPGRDLSVIGSGDQAARRGLSATLSSIRVHYRTMGLTAAFEALCGRRGSEMRTIIVPNRLRLRGSVGPPGTPPADAGR